MTDIRRSNRESVQVYAGARAAIAQQGAVKDTIVSFLRDFESHQEKKYMKALQQIADGQLDVLEIALDDVRAFTKKDLDLSEQIMHDAQRFETYFYEACEGLMPTPSTGLHAGALGVVQFKLWLDKMQAESKLKPSEAKKLKLNFQVRFRPSESAKTLPLRQIRASCVGSMVSLDCVITKVGQVQPRFEIAMYQCDVCQQFQCLEVSDDSFMPISECPSDTCRTNRVKGKIQLQHRTSKMIAHQEVRVQEPARDVPMGSVPRSMKVVLRGGSLCNTLVAGESVTLTGMYLPVKSAGFSKIRKGNQADMQLHVHYVVKHKGASGTDDEATVAAINAEINRVAESGEGYEQLAKSIAPEIYGHVDVKKALLLMLVGGVTKELPDVRIRGDIHILLMGDPGIAKSQLLKQVCQIAPRAIYTTGKGSSGVGLTACVSRDKQTGEVSLEGGALVLADNGVCCIDEFDKMDESDRTAIHEVMEQQIVSIAKAGITTTLNARASLLAAANPAFGRYNPDVSVQQNINLPASLLSRFDLQFLLLDKVSPESDMALARHVGAVHRTGQAPKTLDFEPFDAKFIRSYILRTKQFEPDLDKDILQEIANTYVNARAMDRQNNDGSHVKSVTNVRTLLGMLRLAQAHARLRFSNMVERADFEEAVRLTIEAQQSVVESRNAKGHRGPADELANVWGCVKTKLEIAGADNFVLLSDIEKFAMNQGYTLQQIQDALKMYEDISIISFNDQRNRICLVSSV